MRRAPIRHGAAASAVILLAASGHASAVGPGSAAGAKIVERCRSAYGGLHSYRGTTRAHVSRTTGALTTSRDISARVQFVRPESLRVDGKAIYGAEYFYVTNPAGGWIVMDPTRSSWRRVKDAEAALESATGISQNAGSLIPAALLRSSFASPFPQDLKLTGLESEVLGGRAVYRVAATSAVGSITYWIDRSTFLLVKMSRRTPISINGRAGTMETIFRFEKEERNPEIPVKVFAKPAGAE